MEGELAATQNRPMRRGRSRAHNRELVVLFAEIQEMGKRKQGAHRKGDVKE